MKIHHSLYKFLIVFITITCVLSGCRQETRETTASAFDAYTEQLFRDEISENTINLHYTLAYPENYGISEYTPDLGNFTLEELSHRTEELLLLTEELQSFDYHALSTEQQFTYDILSDYLETELSASDLYLYQELLSPTVGYQAQLPVLLAEYTFRTERDITDYLALCSQIEEIFDTLLEFERAKSSAGLFMADFAADNIIAQMENFIASPEENYMIEIFNDKIDAFADLTEEQRSRYKEQNRDTIIHSVVPAYQKLIDGLSSLKGTGQNPGGLCYLPDGSRYYEYLVKTHTGSSKTVEELKQITANTIYECLMEIFTIKEQNPQVLESFDSFSFPLTEPEAILKDLMAKVSTDFPEPPAVHYTIKYVHDSMAENSSPAFYLTPPIDDIQNNIIYINPLYYTDDIYPTIAHEGYPGHLYQTVYTSSKNLPLVRNLFSYPGYSEGWATYVEYYSYNISGIDADLAQICSLNSAATLGLYAYIDLCVNYDGWDAMEVNTFLSQYGYTELAVAEKIFQVMVEEPANYLSYFIGYTEFLELREEAQQLCGDNFSAKEFHDIILSLGPAPFDLLSNYMKSQLQ